MEKVSVHGGHCSHYCSHAESSLEEVVETYIRYGYKWVGITEHIPPLKDEFLYPDEIEQGVTSSKAKERFGKYFNELKRLKNRFKHDIGLYIGFETEAYSGFAPYVKSLIERYNPDYIVGSVHHVNDVPIDYSLEEYSRAINVAGGKKELYCQYFDLQYKLLQELNPAVVGHFDLIRIFDPEYGITLSQPEVKKRIERNLSWIRDNNLILDFNLRSLKKGADEPYVSRSILEKAFEFGVNVVPGDDSHGAEDIDVFMDKGMKLLRDAGFTEPWPKPNIYKYD